MEDHDGELHRDYASATEAMRLLNVKSQTLYAYVSRGWIHSLAQKGLKEKLYLRDDLTRVAMRSLARSGHGPVAASAMNWGEPIFPTAITEISAQGPVYRGCLAADLVDSGMSFEAVSELLWTDAESATEKAQAFVWPERKPPAELLMLVQTLTSLQAPLNLLE